MYQTTDYKPTIAFKTLSETQKFVQLNKYIN